MAAAAWAMVRACGGFAVLGSSLRSDRGLLGLCAVLVGFLAYASIDGLLYHAIALIHFALLAALLFATLNKLAAALKP